MLKWLLRRGILRFGRRYDYAVDYMEHLLDADTSAFLKFSAVTLVSGHRRDIPATPWFAASLCAASTEDCGPCVQLVSNMALEAGVEAGTVAAILRRDYDWLAEDVALVLRFTEKVLVRDPDAETERQAIRARWGEGALISVGFAISASRVYPAFKYSLGYGHACSRIELGAESVVPVTAALAR